MRKCVLSVLSCLCIAGLALAAEVSFVKYDKEKKELTVKEGEKTSTYTITDDTKAKRGDAEGKLKGALKYLEERAKEGDKFEVTVDSEKKSVTELKLKGQKK